MTDNEQRQWNRLWEMYGSGALWQADHTAYLLCEYDSGINGEGHSGWFFNHRVRLPEWIATYQSVLPKAFYANLCMAYESCGTDREDAICAVADDWFYAHEEQITALIRQRAIELKA